MRIKIKNRHTPYYGTATVIGGMLKFGITLDKKKKIKFSSSHKDKPKTITSLVKFITHLKTTGINKLLDMCLAKFN